MKGMRKIVLLIAAILSWGCYDLTEGSIADIFKLDYDEETDADYTDTDVDADADTDVDADADTGEEVWTGCPEDAGLFDEMKTGDACYFGMCGYTEAPEAETYQQSRFAICVDGIAAVSESFQFAQGEPEDVVWTDCNALSDSLDGESCEGEFNCFDEYDNGCMEHAFCEESQMRHRYLCNDLGEYTTSSEVVYAGCSSLMGARPLDLCTGVFVCTGSMTTQAGGSNTIGDEMTEIPRCGENGSGFCAMERIWDWADLVYCDGQYLHFFSNFYVV